MVLAVKPSSSVASLVLLSLSGQSDNPPQGPSLSCCWAQSLISPVRLMQFSSTAFLPLHHLLPTVGPRSQTLKVQVFPAKLHLCSWLKLRQSSSCWTWFCSPLYRALPLPPVHCGPPPLLCCSFTYCHVRTLPGLPLTSTPPSLSPNHSSGRVYGFVKKYIYKNYVMKICLVLHFICN